MSKSLSGLRSFLKSEKLDAFLVLTKTNRQYLSGFTGSSGTLVISRHSAALFVDGRYTLRAKRESQVPIRSLGTIVENINKHKIRKIGVEDRITLSQFKFLKKQLPGKQWKVTHDWTENLRTGKNSEELANISKGSQLIDKAFRMVLKLARRKNITESEIAHQIEKFGKARGAALAFDPIVAWGANAASPHHFSSNTKLGKNNFLLLDFGYKVNGYHSDFTRTIFLGKPGSLHEKVYETVLAAQLAAISRVKIGQRASNVDNAARSLIDEEGFGQNFTHSTGHGVGLEIHELPNFSAHTTDVLRKNSVVTVEPGIYLPGKFGVRIEDMILVGERPAIFSKISKSFKDMII
jgi:Xaa-Pro aminopeptidase